MLPGMGEEEFVADRMLDWKAADGCDESVAASGASLELTIVVSWFALGLRRDIVRRYPTDFSDQFFPAKTGQKQTRQMAGSTYR
eukprot:scaffold59150_cov40-Attheya_sp.AAC.2